MARSRRSRLIGPHGRRRAWRRRNGLSGAHRGDGGDLARLGRGGLELRRAFESLREPVGAQRFGGAKAALPAQAHQRRARRRTGHVGARRRFRCGFDAAQGGPPRRSLHARRAQDVDNQRPGGRCAGGLRQDRAGSGLARHQRLHHRKGIQRIHAGAKARQARHARLQHQRAGVRSAARCPPPTCWARKIRASTC